MPGIISAATQLYLMYNLFKLYENREIILIINIKGV